SSRRGLAIAGREYLLQGSDPATRGQRSVLPERSHRAASDRGYASRRRAPSSPPVPLSAGGAGERARRDCAACGLHLLRSDVRNTPLVIAWDAWEPARRLGEILARLVGATGEPVLLLASSDLNHYEPAAVSEQKDARALEAVRALNGEQLLERCKREHISMC